MQGAVHVAAPYMLTPTSTQAWRICHAHPRGRPTLVAMLPCCALLSSCVLCAPPLCPAAVSFFLLQVVWAMYLQTMKEAGFDANTPLFVATGLLSYGAELEFQGGVSMLIGTHLASEVLYKEQYVPPFELQRECGGGEARREGSVEAGAGRGRQAGAGTLRAVLCLLCCVGALSPPPSHPCAALHAWLTCPAPHLPHHSPAGLNSEQLALLDFLILARAEKYVGFAPSTFSFYLREHRILHGGPPSQSVLVNASRIGTDELFARSALVARRTFGNGQEGDGTAGL